MIQPFCSIYTKSYRAFDRDSEVEKAKPCLYFSDLKENFLPLEDSKTIYNPERDEVVIKDLHLKRLVTVYQQSYCMSEGKKSMVIDPNNLEADEFMVHFNNYYAKKTHPVPRPLLTARRVFGYCRFENYYTGKSTYEDEICVEAYKYFKKDYDEGKSRLFAKKQKAMQKQNPEEKSEKEIKTEPETMPAPKEKKPDVPQKLCVICCEKFGDFSCGKPPCQESNGQKSEPQKGAA